MWRKLWSYLHSYLNSPRKHSGKTFLLTVPRRYFFCGSYVLFMSSVCHAFASVHCCLVVTWRERADLLALVCDVYCDFCYFPIWFLGQVWYLIVSIPDPCCLSYFYIENGCLIKHFKTIDSFHIVSAHAPNSLVSRYLREITREGATCKRLPYITQWNMEND